MNDASFICAICQQERENRWLKSGRNRHIAPLCWSCEESYRARVTAGSFMDRRKASQIFALSEALCGKAHALKWEAQYGRA
ncbi:hypothetical protein MKK88_05645 [Methylobacterium sp. E-005]|uniref:hypothetical protein n=1 Tax=Methylobacterium sp. E-005 TaxID=2836549 RepID=UPI001FB9E2C2|nr:hypothetical protein [Methylobacterium sp. E-005]MCJ2085478.1 hypothetical protein [Methylobacterium sp. E-005]